MGWFFGCFGGSGKKDRKHRTPASPLPKQQKPFQAAPVRVPAAVSSSIPIKTGPVAEAGHDDLFTVRQVSTSAPAMRHPTGTFLQNRVASDRTPEKQQKPGPWYQLDDLEEELEDLRKQIDKESQDAKNINLKDEVSFLKSCGALVKTPSELKSPHKVKYQQQSSSSEKGWRSWLVPLASPNRRTSPAKNLQFEGLKAALCEPTPAKECHSLLFGVQTPVSSTPVTRKDGQHSMGAQFPLLEEQHNGSKEEPFDTAHVSLPCHDNTKNIPTGMEALQKKLNVPNSGLHDGSDNKLDGLNKSPKSILKKQVNGTFCSNAESSPCEGDSENENSSTKKRRLTVNAVLVQSSHAMKKPVDRDAGSGQDNDALSQKRLKVVLPEEKSLHTVPVPMHFFRCESLSPIMESKTLIEETSSYGDRGVSTSSVHQLQSYNSHNSATQTSSQSPSFRQSPASQTKSVTFASNTDEDYTTDGLSYNRDALEKCSEGSYTNSTCFNDTNGEDEDDGVATGSYSSSVDSEETLSDLSPEHCFSPPMSPSHKKSSTAYRSHDHVADGPENQTAKHHNISSTQYSSVHGGRRKHPVARYDSEDDGDMTEDDYDDLFTDAMSHVSTECSERERGRWHDRTESMDSVSANIAQFGHVTDSNLIETPPKVSGWMVTPNIDIPGRVGRHTSRLRSKPASSVLTPVENVSQWKQLKERDHEQDVIAKLGNDESSRIDHTKYAMRAGDSRSNLQNENKNSAWNPSKKGTASDAELVNVMTSLSHWPSALKGETIRTDASFSQWGMAAASTETEAVRVDVSLSHWLRSSYKNNEVPKSLETSSTTSSGGGVISSAPKLHYVSPNSVAPSQKTHSARSERPILRTVGEDYPTGITQQRSPWDGKCTPNSTAKYMEDQRVKWHSSPFDQTLEKALDKQGILSQKKLFAATSAAR